MMFHRSTLLVALLAPASLMVVVEAGFDDSELLGFLAALPNTCDVSELFECVDTNINGACSGCFNSLFNAPPIPDGLPTTCEESVGMMDAVCALQACCAPCAESIGEVWTCSAEGVPGIEELDDCPLSCPANASYVTVPTADQKFGLFSVPQSVCVEAGTAWMECATSTTQADLEACFGCAGEIAMEAASIVMGEDPSDDDLCDAFGGTMCGIEPCCPQCATEASDMTSCILNSGADFAIQGDQDNTFTCSEMTCPISQEGEDINDTTVAATEAPLLPGEVTTTTTSTTEAPVLPGKSTTTTTIADSSAESADSGSTVAPDVGTLSGAGRGAAGQTVAAAAAAVIGGLVLVAA